MQILFLHVSPTVPLVLNFEMTDRSLRVLQTFSARLKIYLAKERPSNSFKKGFKMVLKEFVWWHGAPSCIKLTNTSRV